MWWRTILLTLHPGKRTLPGHSREDRTMKRITDSTFRYVPSFATDIRVTFARAHKAIARAAKRAAKRGKR